VSAAINTQGHTIALLAQLHQMTVPATVTVTVTVVLAVGVIRHDIRQPRPQPPQMGNGKIAQLWAGRLHSAMARRNLDMMPYADSCWKMGVLGLNHG